LQPTFFNIPHVALLAFLTLFKSYIASFNQLPPDEIDAGLIDERLQADVRLMAPEIQTRG
jgi:hypothetical protein